MKVSLPRQAAGVFFVCIFVLLASSVSADDDRARFGLGAGVFDTFDHMDTLAASLTFEARPINVLWNLRPTVQGMVIDESGYYVGLGALKEFTLGSTWSWGLGFSAGLAHESEESRALEYDIEFYSRIYVQRQLDQNNALRLELGHISNGGLHETNPGTEPLLLFWVRNF